MPGLSLGLSLSMTSGTGVAAFDPASLSPTAWWDTADSSKLFTTSGGSTTAVATDPLGRVEDKAGTNHLVQATAGKRPTLTANGADFDGTDDGLVSSAALNGTFDIWVVIKSDGGSFVTGFDPAGLASEYFGVVVSADGTSSRGGGVTDHEVYVNGSLVGSAGAAPTRGQLETALGSTNKKVVEFRGVGMAFSTMGFGDYAGGLIFNGQIGEILVLTGMDATKRTNLLTYLTSKWGAA